jgi:light-regulated signal transduction histidine kinase (bacteriophytochrome)
MPGVVIHIVQRWLAKQHDGRPKTSKKKIRFLMRGDSKETWPLGSSQERHHCGARSIVELHGGTISVGSGLGEATTFAISLLLGS